MTFFILRNNKGSVLAFGLVLLGFLSTLSISMIFLLSYSKKSLENRIWTSKALVQSETSLRSSGQFFTDIPELSSTDTTTLFLEKESGFRFPGFTLPNYLFRSSDTLYSVLDWGHTRCVLEAEYSIEKDTITVRKIQRL